MLKRLFLFDFLLVLWRWSPFLQVIQRAVFRLQITVVLFPFKLKKSKKIPFEKEDLFRLRRSVVFFLSAAKSI